MTEPVKRYMHIAPICVAAPAIMSIYPMATRYVLATDYERLEQECADAKCQAELFKRAAEVFREDKTTALQLLAQCQEHLDPHRDAVLWGRVVEAIRCAPTK